MAGAVIITAPAFAKACFCENCSKKPHIINAHCHPYSVLIN